MLTVRVTRNIALFLVISLAGMLILTQAVYSDSDGGMIQIDGADAIRWYISVGSLKYEDSETYSSHAYKIGLYKDIADGVYGKYEFAHFVHDLTLGGPPVRETKVLDSGPTLKKKYKVDNTRQGVGASVYGLDPGHDYKIEAYTRLEIYKDDELVDVPGRAELKVTEEKMITIQ